MFHSTTSLPVQIQPAHLRPLAYRTLSKKYGLSIKSDGLAALAKFIGDNFGMDWKKNGETIKFLENFAIVWKQQERGLFVDSNGANQVIAEIQERHKALSQNVITATKEAHKRSSANNLDRFLHKKTVDKSPTPKESTQVDSIPIDENTQISEDEDESMIANTSLSLAQMSDADMPDSIGINSDSLAIGDEPSHASINDDMDVDHGEQLSWRDYFKIINATELQKFTYDPLKMQFKFTPSNRTTATDLTIKLPSVKANTTLFSTRYYLVKDRIMRNEAFQNEDAYNPLSSMLNLKKELTANNGPASSYMSITPVKNLLGRDGKNFLLLGLLRKNIRGIWTLEDPSGIVEIDISQAIPTSGLYYTPGCIVIAEGIYFTVGNKFHVTSMTHPPGERRETTLDTIGNIDLLGINGISNPNYISRLDNDLKIRLHYLEKELEDHRCVILGGDIFLDELATLEALKKVFIKLNEDPPTVIIFQGSFSSTPVHASMTSKTISSTTQYKNNFDTLANLLSEFENITTESTLLFIPGVNDPWSSLNSLGSAGLLPQRPIPTSFTQRVNRVCKNVVWGSNPVRIAYLSQEIIVMRDDMADRFKRHSVVFPMVEQEKEENVNELQEELENVSLNDSTIINQLIKDKHQLTSETQQSRKYVKTLLDQGHLSPFLNTIRPIVWDLDHSLTLHPIPSTLIICDTTAPKFDVTYNGCKAINPGKFISNRRARYLEYRPASKKSYQEEVYF